jgi:hypothetical protein
LLLSVAVRARAIEDDLNELVFLVFFHEAHQAEGVEELGGDVAEDPGTLGGDAIADQEKQEPGQELVDLIGGVKLRELHREAGLRKPTLQGQRRKRGEIPQA